MTQQNLPAHLQDYQSRGLAKTAMANLGTAAPPIVSLKDNRFTAVDAAGNEMPVGGYEQTAQNLLKGQFAGPFLDVVIVDINPNISRIFYDDDYNPHATTYQPPACFSNNGVGPSKQASRPQNAYCATCRQAEWGSALSAVTGKEIPACAQYQFIAVIIPGFSVEMAFLVRIPPNSLKHFRSYSEQFNGQQFDYDAVVTRLSFQSQGTLAFAALGWVDAPSRALTVKLLAAGATDNLIGKNDVPRDPQTLALTAPVPHENTAMDAMAAGAYASTQPGPAFGAPEAPAQQPAQPAATGRGRGRGRPPKAAEAAPAGPRQAPFGQAPQQEVLLPGQPMAAGQPQQGGFQPQPGQFQPGGLAPAFEGPQGGQQAGPAAAPPNPHPAGAFGVQTGVAPNADVQSALQGVFGR